MVFLILLLVCHLGYLQDKNLKKASEVFCKTSPHLQEEYELLKRGVRARRIIDLKLIEVLEEYCEIRSIGMFVSQFEFAQNHCIRSVFRLLFQSPISLTPNRMYRRHRIYRNCER